MRTILYQPIFINPQAYFVFPQLYHIEKGDSFIEPAYITIGAVVLGEWYIPGTFEPERPDWFKKSIVAWYSPCCKRGNRRETTKCFGWVLLF